MVKEHFKEGVLQPKPEKLERYERPPLSPIESAWDKWKADNTKTVDNSEENTIEET